VSSSEQLQLNEIKNLIVAGDLVKASAACRSVIEKTDSIEAIFLLGIITSQMGLHGESLTLFEKAAAQLPERSDVAYNYGNALQAMGKLDAAIGQWSRAAKLNPKLADAHFNLGLAFSKKTEWANAIVHYEMARDLQPGNAVAHYSLGNANFRSGSREAARECFECAVALNPEYTEAWINLGLAALRIGDSGFATEALEKAIDLDPSNIVAHFNLGQALLHEAMFERGYAECEWRRRAYTLPFPEQGQPAWEGGNPSGQRVLVYAEQGHGDTIQFLRYAQGLSERGATVLLHCHPSLVHLFEDAAGIDSVSSFGDPPAEFETYAPLVSLPHLLRQAEPDSAPPAPYLSAPSALKLPDGENVLKVGLVWAGNPLHDDDANRSVPLTTLGPLLEIKNIRFFSLQVGDRSLETIGQGKVENLTDLAPDLSNYQDTAAAISALDLVISVDTSVAHLAGALGSPVWLLLPRIADWRWPREGERTPWYPTMRLFRQEDDAGWPPVIGRVRESLLELAD